MTHGAVQHRPVDFNKANNLNWWWGGWDDIDSMVDVAGAWMVEENKAGSLAALSFAEGWRGRRAQPQWFASLSRREEQLTQQVSSFDDLALHDC